jgi:hypothetical protein
MFMSRLTKVVLTILLCLPSAGLLYGQPGSNPGGGGKPGVPISGIEILLTLGGIAGIKKIIDSRRRKS